MLKFVAWTPGNSVPEFECKDPQINRYYKEQLQTDIDVRACRAYFLFQDDDVVGFFTLLPHSIKNVNSHRIRERELKGMGKWLSGVLLGHFAVNNKFCKKQYNGGLKYSKILMFFALSSFERVVRNFCGVALLLNPINENVKDKFYVQEYGDLFKKYPTDDDDYMYARTVDVLTALDKWWPDRYK